MRRRAAGNVREMLQPGAATTASAAAPSGPGRGGAKRGRGGAGGGGEAAPGGAGSKRQRRAAPSYATHAERRARRADAAIDELLDELPPWVETGVLGRGAAAQVPDAGARRRLLRKYLRKHVGPSGERAKKGLRAWRRLQEVAARRLLPNYGLPASAALVADCVAEELQRAIRGARDGQDGHSVGSTFRDGFRFLEKVAKLRVEASGPLVEAAAEPPAELPARAVRHAGTLPIAVQCAFEEVAAEPGWSVRRTLARCFLVTVFAHHIRLCDALNAQLWPDELPSPPLPAHAS